MWDGPLSPWERRLRRRAELFFERDAEPEDRLRLLLLTDEFVEHHGSFSTYRVTIVFLTFQPKELRLPSVEGANWRNFTNRSPFTCIDRMWQ